jgi:drug/metabolite transporter (DMT)-like permease
MGGCLYRGRSSDLGRVYERFKYQIWLHVAILIFGTTGILGRLITVDAFHTVWHRLWIAVGTMALALLVARHRIAVDRERLFKILGTGAILVAHWVTFFEAINRANVSAALVCLSSTAFFTSILEPIYYKRRIAWREPVFGLCIVVGLYFVFRSELQYATGMAFGIVSAIFAAWFTVINGLLVRQTDAKTITFYELLGAFFALTLFMLATGTFDRDQFFLSRSDFGWLLILGTVCTVFSFLLSVLLMKRLTPYTFAMAINLEPIYTMILAVLIWPETETMSPGFYFGAAIVLAVISLNGFVANRIAKRSVD